MKHAQPTYGADYQVILLDSGTNKIGVIKTIMDYTGVTLKDAKTLADNAPQPVMQGVPRAKADMFARALTEAGAVAEIQ